MIEGRYRILDVIASGEMGRVYRAERVKIGRVVAIKFLHDWSAAKPKMRERFELEAQAMGRLDHPNCAAVIDAGVVDGVPYVVMDYVSGETVRTMLDRGPLSPAEAMDILGQVLKGLAHAHAHGIIHRDIKPANVMVGEVTAVGRQVKILDFGLARLGDTAAPRLTGAGSTVGTPAYMAPEQCLAGDIDERTDVYACGVLLFEMLTGKKPFWAKDPIEILEMQCRTPAPRLDAMVPRSFGELEAVCARALAKDPRARFQSAAEFVAALDQIRGVAHGVPMPVAQRASGPVAMHAAGFAPMAAPRLPGRVLGVTGAVVVLIIIAVGAALTSGGSDPGDAGLDAVADEIEDAMSLEEDLEASAPELPVVTEAKALLAEGRKRAAIQRLENAKREHPDSAEVHYLLGRLYFDRLWWSDGIQAFRKAIAIDPRYRSYAPLIKSALQGFIVTPDSHPDIAEFLREDIGEPARPYLEETAREHPRKRVRERAEQELGRY